MHSVVLVELRAVLATVIALTGRAAGMAPSFFVPVSAEALSLRDCIDVCGAAGGTPACASALAIESNVRCNGTAAGTCDVWLGHHRHEFGSGAFDSCLASLTAEPAASVAPAGSYTGSSYGNAIGEARQLSNGPLPKSCR